MHRCGRPTAADARAGRQRTRIARVEGCRLKESTHAIMSARLNFLAGQTFDALESQLQTLTSLCDRQSPSACISAIRGQLVLGFKLSAELVELGIHGCRQGVSDDLMNDCERLYQLGCSLSVFDCIPDRKGSAPMTDVCAQEDMTWVATRTVVARQKCQRHLSEVLKFEFGVDGQLLENQIKRKSCLYQALRSMRLIPNRPKRGCQVLQLSF